MKFWWCMCCKSHGSWVMTHMDDDCWKLHSSCFICLSLLILFYISSSVILLYRRLQFPLQNPANIWPYRSSIILILLSWWIKNANPIFNFIHTNIKKLKYKLHSSLLILVNFNVIILIFFIFKNKNSMIF